MWGQQVSGRGVLCAREPQRAAIPGLTAEQLHAVLSAWRALPRGAEGWEEAVAAGSSGDAYPVGPFAYLVQSLRRYTCSRLGPHQSLCLPFSSSRSFLQLTRPGLWPRPLSPGPPNGCHLIHRPAGWDGSHWLCRPLTDSPPLPSALSPSREDSLLGEGPLERAGARLCLPAGPLRTAAQCRYGKRWGLQKTAHVLIAGDDGQDWPAPARALRVGPPPGARTTAGAPIRPAWGVAGFCCSLGGAILGDSLGLSSLHVCSVTHACSSALEDVRP